MSPLPGIYASQITGYLYDNSSFVGLASVQVPAGATLSEVVFAGIPSGYKDIQIRAISRTGNTGYTYTGAMYMQLNGDTSNSYSFHTLRSSGSGTLSSVGQNSTGNNVMYVGAVCGAGSSNSLIYGTSVIDLLDYSSTQKNKVIRVTGGSDFNGSGFAEIDSGAWYNTSAVTSIRLYPGGDSFAQYTHISLYGVL